MRTRREPGRAPAGAGVLRGRGTTTAPRPGELGRGAVCLQRDDRAVLLSAVVQCVNGGPKIAFVLSGARWYRSGDTTRASAQSEEHLYRVFALIAAFALAAAACGGGKSPSRSPAAPSPASGTPRPDAPATPGGAAIVTTPVAVASLTAAMTPPPSGSVASTSPIPPPASSGRTATFTSGVASGDVTSTSAVLWTRADGGDVVDVEIARTRRLHLACGARWRRRPPPATSP